MLNKDFIWWLHGYLADARQGLSQEDVEMVKQKLNKVIYSEISDEKAFVMYDFGDGPPQSC